MKKKNYILVVAAAILAASCVEGIDSAVTHEKNVTITAYSAEAEGTRSTLIDGGTKVYWEPGDKIKLFAMGTSSCLETTVEGPELVATFSGSFPFVIGSNEGQSTSTTLWALYPYRDDASFANDAITTILPTEQTARDGSFSQGMNITLAKANSFDLGFYNVCGGVRFRLSREGINRVVFTANGGEAVSGKFKTTFDDGIPVVSEILDGKDSVALTMPNSGAFETGKWYYICALPSTLSGGFTMRLETQTHYAEFSSSKSVSIKRSIFGQLDNFDEYLTFTKKGKEPENPGAVDLGLSVQWATCNLGASKPEEYGGYYQWAGVEDVTSTEINLGISNCPYHYGSSNTNGWTKYIPSDKPSYWYPEGEPDNKTALDPEDDAAHASLGGSWYMPTSEDFKELQDNCDAEWTTLNGVYGRRFTSRKNGNRIFLPAAGYRYDKYSNNVGSSGSYWSSTLHTDAPDHAYYFSFGSDEVRADNSCRFYGRSVRPVYVINVTGVGLNTTSLSMFIREKYTLRAIITPSNASVQGVSWSSSNPDVVTVDQNGKVTTVNTGNAIITVTTKDGGFTAKCSVSVTKMNILEPEAVDMGLSVRWASFNLGATKREESGGYYQWAGTRDVRSTSININWDNCPFHTGSYEYTGWTKYIPLSMSSYWSGAGDPDDKTVLDPEDDAAYIAFGGNWRMPTKEEWQELIDNCDVEWTTLNNVVGRKFTSRKTGYTEQWIFLPASGYRHSAELGYVNLSARYLSSSLNLNSPTNAHILFFSETNIDSNSIFNRRWGSSVRPVLK